MFIYVIVTGLSIPSKCTSGQGSVGEKVLGFDGAMGANLYVVFLEDALLPLVQTLFWRQLFMILSLVSSSLENIKDIQE